MSLTITPTEIVAKAEASGAPGLLAKAEHWNRVSLGEVAKVVNGAAFPSAGFNLDGRGMPLVRIRDVGAKSSATWFEGPWEQKHLVKHGDILIGMDGDFRVARWEGEDALLNQRVCRIDVNEDRYLGSFLVLVLQGYLDAIWSETSSITVKHLSSRSVAAIPLPGPPIEEQRGIVNLLEDHLSRLNAAESLVTTSLLRLMSLRKSVLAELHDGDPTALGELAVDSGYGTSEKCVPEGLGPSVVRIPNLVDGHIDLSDEKRIASTSVDVERYSLAPGDLLIVRTNGSVDLIGRSAVVQDGVDAAFASYLIRYRLRPDRVMPEWVQAMLSTPQVRAKIERLAASSAGQHNLSLGKLNPLEIPVPTLALQASRLSRLADIDEQVGRLRGELFAAQSRGVKLRRSLLAAAFSGRLTCDASDLSKTEEMGNT